MMAGGFVIGDLYSGDIDAKIQKRPQLDVPRRKANAKDIPGKNGIVFFDENAYENTVLNLDIAIKAKSVDEAETKRNIILKAFNDGGYVKFRYYADPNKEYYVHLENMSFAGNRLLKDVQIATLELSVKPFKLKAGDNKIVSSIAINNIRNPYLFASVPVIMVEGTGDGAVDVNGEKFSFKGMEGHLYIDSTVEHSYKIKAGKKENENKKITTLDYPLLKEGVNTITFSGGVTKITIDPRWQTLI